MYNPQCRVRKTGHKAIVNWVAPCMPAQCDSFVPIFQVEIWHVYSFCVKKYPCISLQECRKIWTKLRENPSPPSLCPSPNNVGFWSLRAKTLCMCFLRYWREVGGGGGSGREGVARRGEGVDFQERVWSLVSPLVEKNGATFTEKESACQISADSEQFEKSPWNHHIGLACTETFNSFPTDKCSVLPTVPWPQCSTLHWFTKSLPGSAPSNR